MNIIKYDKLKRIYYVDSFWKEYRSLFGKSERDFFDYSKKLISNLSFLDNIKNMQLALQNPNIEKLVNTPLYSIRHRSKLNPRVIFICCMGSEDNPGAIILLASILEKSASDYSRAIDKATLIIKNFEE